MKTTVISSIVLIAITGGQPTSAAVITFTNRAMWETAIGGGPNLVVDFNGVIVDTPFLGAPFDAGPFSLSANLLGEDYIDTAPFHPGFAIDNTPHVHASLGSAASGEVVEMMFDVQVVPQIVAWGADFSELDFGGVNMVLASDIGTTTIPIPNGSSFFGFTLSPPETISTITFVGGGSGEDFGMDNVSLVPEPGALPVLLFVWMTCWRRRRHSECFGYLPANAELRRDGGRTASARPER